MEIKIKWVVILLISMVFFTFWFCAHFEMWSTEDLDPEEASEPFKVSNPHTFDSLQKDIIFDLEGKPNEMFSTTTEFSNGNWYNVKSSEDRYNAELEEASTQWWDNFQFQGESTTTDMTTDEYFDWDVTTTDSGQYFDWDATTTTESGQYFDWDATTTPDSDFDWDATTMTDSDFDWDATTTTESGQYFDWDATTTTDRTGDQFFDWESNSVSQELGQDSLTWQDITAQAKNNLLSREPGSTQSTTESTTEATTTSVWRQNDYTDATDPFDASTTTETTRPDEDYEQTAEYSVGPEDQLTPITSVEDDNTVSTGDELEPSYSATPEDELASTASVSDDDSEATVAGNEPSYMFTSEELLEPAVSEDDATAAASITNNNDLSDSTLSEDKLASITSIYDEDSEATALAVDNQSSYSSTSEDEPVSTAVEEDDDAPTATEDNTETNDSVTSVDHDYVASNMLNSNELSDSVFSLNDISSILLPLLDNGEPTPSEDKLESTVSADTDDSKATDIVKNSESSYSISSVDVNNLTSATVDEFNAAESVFTSSEDGDSLASNMHESFQRFPTTSNVETESLGTVANVNSELIGNDDGSSFSITSEEYDSVVSVLAEDDEITETFTTTSEDELGSTAEVGHMISVDIAKIGEYEPSLSSSTTLEDTENNNQAPNYSQAPEDEISSNTSVGSDDFSTTDNEASEKSIANKGSVVQTSDISEVEDLAPSGFLSNDQSLINMYENPGSPSEDVPQSQGTGNIETPGSITENIETPGFNTETSSDADTKTILSTMKNFASQIQQRCLDLKHLGLLNDSDSNTNATGGVYLMVSDTYRFMGCKAAKVGGTNLQRLVYGLENDILDVASLKQSLARKQTIPMMLMNLTNQTERLESYVKFMIYRDPLERLVSAFRDRKPGSYFSSTEPTFEEYVEEASASDPVVQHSHRPWREIHALCNPCDIPYDYILPLSMYTEGISAILSSLGVPSLNFPTREETSYKPKSSEEVATQFYSNIPNTVKEKLKQKYALDYYLFYGQMYFQA